MSIQRTSIVSRDYIVEVEPAVKAEELGDIVFVAAHTRCAVVSQFMIRIELNFTT